MHHTLLMFNGTYITGWKLIGYLGVLTFASRWFVQLYASKKAGRSVLSPWFWLLSLMGSSLLLMYFIFGKNDSVGIIANIFPVFVALYNIFLEIKHYKKLRFKELQFKKFQI